MQGEFYDNDNKTDSEMRNFMPKKFTIHKKEYDDLIKGSTSPSDGGSDEKNKEYMRDDALIDENLYNSFNVLNPNKDKCDLEADEQVSFSRNIQKAANNGQVRKNNIRILEHSWSGSADQIPL